MFLPKSFLIFFLAFALFFAFNTQAHADSNPTCVQQTVTVNLSATDPTPYHVVGWLCWNGSLQNKTVQVTIPGGTYSHVYWDFPFNPLVYSYTRAANNAGYATFNIDKLGSGLSDHPTPELVDMPTLIYNLHQIVQDLKSGSIGNHVFAKVMLVGHSIGAEVAMQEAGTYQDVDGIILTGQLHNVNQPGLDVAIANSYPAAFDPQFSPTLPLGYLTTQPGTRGETFYNTSFVDPQVLTADEQTKDLVTDGTLNTFFPLIFTHVSNNIHVPTFVIVGEKDSLNCPNAECSLNFVKTNEGSYYAPDSCVQFAVIPATGHDVNLHFSAPIVTGIQLLWADNWIGSNVNQPIKTCN